MAKDHELQVKMRKDLFAAYRDVCSKPCPTQKVAWLRTVKHPAKRFYILEGIACKHVVPMLRGDFTLIEQSKRPQKKRMYYDIYNICLELMQTKEWHDKPASSVIKQAITMPAPEFYMSWLTFKRIFEYCKRFGTRYRHKEATLICHKFTNYRDGKPKDAVWKKRRIMVGL